MPPMPDPRPVMSPSPFPWRRAAALALLAALAACSSAPPYSAPNVVVPVAWRHAPAAPGFVPASQALPPAQAAAWAEGPWWTLWDDATLAELMQRVDVSNQNLALALANVDQAQALLRQQQAQLWPTLGVQGSAQRSGRPASGSASAMLSASWSPDVWGRLGDAVRAQAASVQASHADLEAARLSAQGSLAQAYFALREADAEIALLDDIVQGYERATTITRNRYQAGIAAHTDLLQAQNTLDNARASRIALQRSRQLGEHAIALLVGRTPAEFSLPVAPWSAAVPAIPTEVPAALLLRRPDVAAAERAVAAANARIGVARSAYFPNIGLSAGLGGRAASVGDLLSAPTLAWSLGLSLAQTLFDAGARSAGVDQALAAHDASAAAYRQSVLTAIGQVEDQLVALQTLGEQIERTRAAAEAAAGAETRIMNRYQAGLSAYTEVVTAQASALNARRSVMQLQLQRQQAALALVQALGGGWVAPWAVAPAPADAAASR